MADAKEKKEPEYPRWVYPPDGGAGKVVQTPDDTPSGWLLAPTEPGPAQGERVIGQPTFTGEDDDGAKKSKKK